MCGRPSSMTAARNISHKEEGMSCKCNHLLLRVRTGHSGHLQLVREGPPLLLSCASLPTYRLQHLPCLQKFYLPILDRSLFLSSPHIIPQPPTPYVIRAWWTSSTEYVTDLGPVPRPIVRSYGLMFGVHASVQSHVTNLCVRRIATTAEEWP